MSYGWAGIYNKLLTLYCKLILCTNHKEWEKGEGVKIDMYYGDNNAC